MVRLSSDFIIDLGLANTRCDSVYLFPVLAMKKFLTNILLYLIVYAVLHVVAVCVFGNNEFINVNYYKLGSCGHMFSRIKDIPGHKNPDILFVGSSHAYRSFDNRIFDNAGITTFNFGSSNQTPIQTEILLKKYLDEINPKSVVFEVYPILFQGNGIESTTDLISNDHIDADVCKLAIKSGNIKVINTLIYGIYQEYCCGIRNRFQEEPIRDGDLYVSGGYVEKLDYSPFVFDGSSNPKPIEIRPKQLRAFSNCIKTIQDKQIPYLLVEAPVPKCTYMGFVNHKEFGEIIHSYGNYIDFNGIMQLHDTCFFDSDHLSQKGVVLFDNCLIQVIDSLELIP